MKNENDDILNILVSESELDAIATRIAAEIDRDFAAFEGRLVLVAVLKGAVVFMGKLMRKVKVPVEIDFMKISSYGSSTRSSGNIRVLLDLERPDIEDCHVIIVEDIIDSGRTLSYLVEHLRKKGVKSVHSCTMLDKPSRREVAFDPDYVGTVIPDVFVVGYGLDYDEKYRTLPYVGVLKPSVYEK